MVAIETSAPPRPPGTAHAGGVLLFALLGMALLVTASLVVADGNGWRVASDMTSHFALLLFVAAMIVEPLARLVPRAPLQAAARERPSLMLAFIGVSAASLACLAAPWLLFGEHLPITSAAYCFLGAIILFVMLFSAHPATMRLLGAPAWRTMQRIATSYFWIVFVLVGIDGIVGPHIPDPWPGFSLLLLAATVLLRFADAFIAFLKTPPLAEKVA
jgi:hypothetical protein